MTQRTTAGNNVTISIAIAASVPIVSQTEIDPTETALSLMLALVTTTALAEPPPVPKPPGQTCDHASGGADGRASSSGSRLGATARHHRRALPLRRQYEPELIHPHGQLPFGGLAIASCAPCDGVQ
jgi:hypothetical protein